MAHSLPSPWPGAYADPTVKTSQMASGVVSGDTSQTLNEILQVQKGLVWFNPSIAPLIRLTSKLKNSKAVEAARFYHLEKQRLPRKFTVTAAQAATSPTTIDGSAADVAKIRVGDILYNTTTGDIAEVTAKNDADTLAVTPNIGDAAPSGTLWANTNVCYIIGNVYLDGSGAGSPLQIVEDEKQFFVQIFKDSIEQSDRYQKTALYEGDPWSNARKQLEQEHLLNIEHTFFFGKPDIKRDATTGKLKTYAGGLNHYCNVNRVDFNGDTSTTKAFIDTVMVEAMRLGHSGFENKELGTKTMLASHKWLAAFNAFGDNSSVYRVVDPSEKTFGLRLMQYQGSWGVLNVINAPVLNRPELAEFAFVLDFEHLRQANFKGRDTKFEDNIQLPDADSRKAQYISDKGLVVEVAPAHTVFYGLA